MILGSIILAGGRSRRMGQAKESLRFGQSTLLGHTVDTLLSCTYPVLVVARNEEQALPPITLEAEVIFDERIDEGPLTGILTGMRHLQGLRECDAVFVTGCDSPFLDAAAVGFLAAHLGDADLVMPRVDSHLQPLCAIYRLALVDEIGKMVKSDIHTPKTLGERAGARILSESEIDAYDPGRSFLVNINSEDDYKAACDRFDGSNHS